MFRKLWLDVILGTLFIFGLMGLFASVTAFRIFDVFDPIGEALGEMQMTDIVFSQLREDPPADERIVLVNMGDLPRRDIAVMLSIISQYNPAVIGIDSFFNFPKEDTLGDMMLAEAMAGVENLVLVTKLISNPETDIVDSVHYSWPLFSQFSEPAFASLPTDAKEQGDLKFCRSMWPQWEVNGERQVAFSVKLASYLDSAAAEDFLARGVEEELINFKGNVLDYGATEFGTVYSALDWMDVFQETFTPELIEGKIVLFCYLGEMLGDQKSLEDKFITPLNARYVGRTLPDMFGGVLHANVVSMILNRDYVDYMTHRQGLIVAVLLCLLNVLLFTIIYKRLPKWYDGITKVFQLIELGLLFTLMIVVFNKFNYKMDLTVAMVAIALAGDSLEVFHGVVKNVFTKAGRKSLFKPDKL
ncbi:MAG: CHASE2 domain-containing protein [Cyclobacteriaceae bacterium]|nr:CHASE2 domain-containing protein [Cyclobacteriaceae bacterium]